ncbi:hypothetical protein J6590_071886 [Homalodisca vitripennis]|nr:hypothetical protein J6590_071886 [Homalodisca vitripennis]
MEESLDLADGVTVLNTQQSERTTQIQPQAAKECLKTGNYKGSRCKINILCSLSCSFLCWRDLLNIEHGTPHYSFVV